MTQDTGCGVGGPAREIARFANCNVQSHPLPFSLLLTPLAQVLGLNNNAYQVKRATMHTEKAGLADQVKFVKVREAIVGACVNVITG